METKLYNQEGMETGNVDISERVFGLPQNLDLIHQVRVGMLANRRKPVAHSKTRAEVSGTGKKPWRQKGTGRARHGSRRSPIWVGGGVAHGPRNDKNYTKKINAQMLKKALNTLLSSKFKSGQIKVVEDFSLNDAKTKSFKELSNKIAGGDARSLLFVLPSRDENILKASRNLEVSVNSVLGLSFLDVLKAKKIVFTKTAVEALNK
ncbi:MAG: 50S ribosomal protein L4 [bacterium]|nr:50S ribosomal protein L4 [bacterium]